MKIIKIIILIILVLLCFRTCVKSHENGKSFLMNLGTTSKEFIEKGKNITNEFTEGYKTPTDSIN